MKQIEYYYNVIYYFFYRSAIKIVNASIFLGMPILKIFYFFINKIPSIRKYYVTKDNDDPLDVAIKRTKKFAENSTVGFGTILGGVFLITVVMFIYIGIYYILKHFFFPSFEDNSGYVLIIMGILAYLTDCVLGDNKYIKKFNKKKGWWRIKWKIITILSPFVSLSFCLYSAWYIDV